MGTVVAFIGGACIGFFCYSYFGPIGIALGVPLAIGFGILCGKAF